jgi:hypothetical protein
MLVGLCGSCEAACVLELRRALIVCCLAASACFSGPTSDWPSHGDGDNGSEEEGTPKPGIGADAGLSGSGPLDASRPSQEPPCAPGDAGDGGVTIQSVPSADDAGVFDGGCR